MGYLDGYESGKYPVAAFDADLHKMAHIVIKLAIMVMADFVA